MHVPSNKWKKTEKVTEPPHVRGHMLQGHMQSHVAACSWRGPVNGGRRRCTWRRALSEPEFAQFTDSERWGSGQGRTGGAKGSSRVCGFEGRWKVVPLLRAEENGVAQAGLWGKDRLAGPECRAGAGV